MRSSKTPNTKLKMFFFLGAKKMFLIACSSGGHLLVDHGGCVHPLVDLGIKKKKTESLKGLENK
jgi:hypothetical protein